MAIEAIATVIAASIAACAALITAFLGSRQQKELAEQTRQHIGKLEPAMARFRDELERSRTLDSFHRHRIHYHLDELNESFVQLTALIQIVGRQVWIYSEPEFIGPRVLEADKRFHELLSRLEVSIRSLASLNVADEASGCDYINRLASVWQRGYMSQLCLHVPAVSQHYDDQQADPDQMRVHWENLVAELGNLRGIVLEIPSTVSEREKHLNVPCSAKPAEITDFA